jgi:hypothetical protein
MKNRRLLNLALALVVLAGVILPGCATGSTGAAPTAAVTAAGAPTAASVDKDAIASPDYAVQTVLWGSPNAERDIKLVKDAGFTWIKQMFQWNYFEGDGKGKINWAEPDRLVKLAETNGLRIVARVDMTPKWALDPKADAKVNGPPKNMSDFGDFLYTLASRYKKGSQYGRINAYEIWNEPNLAREWGGKQPSAKEYVEMLKVAYEAIKKADPSALVITGGLSPTTASGAIATPDVQFLKDMYAAGASKYFDILGVHGAGFKATPEASPDEIAADPKLNHGEGAAGRVYGFRHIEDLRKVMVDNGDEKKRVAVMEFGWTSDNRPGSPYQWHAVTEEEKGDYIVRAYQYAAKNWKPWMAMMTTIYISAPYWTPQDEQYWWCITNPDGTVRPAYDAIKRMPKQ